MAEAAVPVLDQIYPAFVRPGSTNEIRGIGKLEPWPVLIWTETGSPERAIQWTATTNAGVFQVVVPAGAPEGPQFIRLYNGEGASALRFLVVTTDPVVTEVEPNDLFKKAQAIPTLPVSINGRLEKGGDVDSFEIELKAGQTLAAHVDAYLIQSPVDAVLRVLNTNGVQMAWNHDNGRTLDPALGFRAPSDGNYIVQVFGFDHPANSDVRFGGNPKCVYRLRVSVGDVARYTLPLGVQRGSNTVHRLMGWSKEALGDRSETFVDRPGSNEVAVAEARWPRMETALQLPVSEGPEWVTRELGGTLGVGEKLPVPGAVTGCIVRAGEEHRFVIAARKDEAMVMEVLSAEFGFPLDAWVKVEDSKGKELARGDDSDSADPHLEWVAPADGDYTVAVGSLVRKGSPEQVYRLSIKRRRPIFKATVGVDLLTLEPGKTNELKVSLSRKHGYSAKFQVTVEGVPAGVLVDPVDLTEKENEAVLKLRVDAGAVAASGPVRVRVREVEGGKIHWARFEMAGTGENNGVPQGFRHLIREWTDQLWVTVLPPPKKEPEKSDAVKK